MMRYFLLVVFVFLFVFGCTPTVPDTGVEPFVPVNAMVKQPEQNPAPEAKAQNQVFVEIRYPTRPANFTIKKGNEVLWINGFNQPFQVVGDKQDPFVSSAILPGKYYAHIYNQTGAFKYMLVPGQDAIVTVI